MRKKEVLNIAANRGIESSKLRKWELIRAIQRAEGNQDCFRTPVANDCNQVACLWRGDCVGKKIK
ncbi:Rho termination factor N-terminal domain-containing protein [Solemya velesiana gill symbiont]|uniref:SAP domain-containing protein n=1 Tax=Solemya velesiana gill symbiont TaxID=1918948 RepID=A0A1T2KS31_9GAMM|nr:Rho termination factor N-terminal domain-containing protein [Solemya velesiana gill symbiont]OOZ35679.1 SAP domain-containing protein [Solemya velesiana gill symbiont]